MAKQSFSPMHKDLDLHMTITQKKHMEAQQESLNLIPTLKVQKMVKLLQLQLRKNSARMK